METPRHSSKGRVILPRSVRDAHRWRLGAEVIVENTADGILLRSAKPFPPAGNRPILSDCQGSLSRMQILTLFT